jgi:cytochrome c-type protein NapC
MLSGLLTILREQGKVIIGTAVVTLVITLGTIEGEKYFSTTEFCLFCHSMSYVNEELHESSHWGGIGINPNCEDCHLPPQFIKRVESHVVDGIRAIIGELKHDYSTKEAFDERRAETAHHARIILKKWDSSPCRTCHKDVEPSSEEAEVEHKKMETEGATCIDCHQNLAHEEVPEEDLDRGLAEHRIVLKEVEEEEEEDEEEWDEEEEEEEYEDEEEVEEEEEE